MKKIITLLVALALLAGCAQMKWKEGRSRGNQVQNGMTVDQAVAVIGFPPSHSTERYIEWRRGNAQSYDGTAKGSLKFDVQNGVIVNIPDGGIFSAAAVRRQAEKAQAERDAAYADIKAAEAVGKAAEAAREAAEAERTREEVELEKNAASHSTFICKGKSECAKAFALAQIFISERADQKIQVATDTIIETYNPTEVGRIGIKIIKAPSKGESEMIKISPSCKSRLVDSSACRTARTSIYRDFVPYLEASLRD